MTYFDSAEDLTITKQRALQELAKHGVEASDINVFFSELGEKEEYNAQDVLRWLGYYSFKFQEVPWARSLQYLLLTMTNQTRNDTRLNFRRRTSM